MDPAERYPIHFEDESDSDAEMFVVPTPSASATRFSFGSNTVNTVHVQDGDLARIDGEKGQLVTE